MSGPSFTLHTGQRVLELVQQLVAQLDAIVLDGEVRVRVRLKGGVVDIVAKSAEAVRRERPGDGCP